MVHRDESEQSKLLVSQQVSPVIPFKPSRIADTVCDSIEWFLNKTLAAKPDLKFVTGIFAPVDRENAPCANLPVTGKLPECLNGEFVRNGPNPKFAPTLGYHLFDGDGMLHGVRIQDGTASYVNRYVRTNKLKQEEVYGRAKFLKMGDMIGLAGLLKIFLSGLRSSLGVINNSQGDGTGNTALIFHAKQLLALHEGDAPYAVRVLADGDLETTGRRTYGGALRHSFTAHPKVDPVTGEMFAFGYNCKKSPYVTYRVISKEGEMGPPVDITIPKPIMMHDFAITENYAIFMDLALEFEPKEILKGKIPFVWNGDRPARFGILPRYARDEAELRWFELPPLFVFHTSNAWEEGREVVLVACKFEKMDLGLAELDTDTGARLFEFRFDLDTGKASQRQLTAYACDFPRINENYLGRKQQYTYAASFDGMVRICGVSKVDVTKAADLTAPYYQTSGAVVGFHNHGEGCFGSEPIFVPRTNDLAADEDDGYVLSFVTNTKTDKSYVVVLDARSLSSPPVATVQLPHRMPYGFHGIFVTEDQIKSQDEE